ncbi:MAG TPA: hypothetical protein VF624_16540 [Tepidisphaeraceae bacterium]|jgi:hypothetical protein
MTHRFIQCASRCASLCVLIAMAGCTPSKPVAITAPPNDWSTLAGKSNTFEGLAGNSPRGPLLRLEDGSIIGLANFNMWPVTYVGRPVGVVGAVGVGEGHRAGEYVVAVERWYLVKEAVTTPKYTQTPQPRIEPQSLGRAKPAAKGK